MDIGDIRDSGYIKVGRPRCDYHFEVETLVPTDVPAVRDTIFQIANIVGRSFTDISERKMKEVEQLMKTSNPVLTFPCSQFGLQDSCDIILDELCIDISKHRRFVKFLRQLSISQMECIFPGVLRSKIRDVNFEKEMQCSSLIKIPDMYAYDKVDIFYSQDGHRGEWKEIAITQDTCSDVADMLLGVIKEHVDTGTIICINNVRLDLTLGFATIGSFIPRPLYFLSVLTEHYRNEKVKS